MSVLRPVGSVAAGLTFLSITAAGGASAQEPPTITIDPTSGPIGTIVTISGDGCVAQDIEAHVVVGLLGPTELDVFQDVDLAHGGTWTAELLLPSDYPPAAYKTYAACKPFGDDTIAFEYEQLTFEATPAAPPATPVRGTPRTVG